MGLSRVVCILSSAVLSAAAALTLPAQTSRIAAINSAQTVSLPSSVSPKALAALDLGAASAETQLPNITLRFAMTTAQQQALSQLLIDQQNPSSPKYHQWLTPEQLRAQFGLSTDDVAKVSAWLSAQGFTVNESSRSGTFVRFSGTAGQANQALGAEIHFVSLRGERHIASTAPVSLPAAIAAITSTITGLDDFRPLPHHQQGSASTAVNLPMGTARPEYTSSSGNHYLAPGDFYTIYDENSLISSNVNGTGVTIAVMGQSDIQLTDIAAFRSASGLSVNAPTVKLYGTDPGVPSNNDVVESELDLEWAGATAPGATILYVNSTNAMEGSLAEAIDNNLAPIITISYGECEANLGVGNLAYYSELLQMAAAEGITITAAGGDSGATDCDVSVASATNGLAVDFPASSPLVTAVGGTEFNEGSGTYFSASNGAYSGSALSYIPEIVWNDDKLGSLSAGGGGRSAYFPKPSWQTGNGVPADFSRDVPDVALNASTNHDPYLICTNGSCTSGYSNSSGLVQYIGGTSVVAPAFAGLLALVEQKTGGRLGNANPMIYALANSAYAGSVFHDITTGTNASPCTTGSPDCPTGGTIGFAAAANYDLATGWGSVDAANLVNDWTLVTPPSIAATGATPTFTNVSGTTNSAAAGTAISLTATVASADKSSTKIPTGSIQFTVDSVAVRAAVALSNTGTAAYSLDTTGLSVGSHKVQATYTGDATYAGSKSAFAITITPANGPDFALTPATATVTVAAGGTSQGLTLTINALNGFTGNVQFAASAAATLNAQYSFSTNPVVITSTNTSGTTTLTLFAYANTTSTALQQKAEGPRGTLWLGGSAIAMAGFLLLVSPSRKRSFPMLFGIVFCTALLGASGCASGNAAGTNGIATPPPTPTGTYSVVISAASTINGVSTTHSTNITFVVQ